MNKSTKIIIECALGVAIIGLAIWLYSSIMQPVKFDNEFNKRREACAERLKTIRTLEEAYRLTYGTYCASFDTLCDRLLHEDSMRVVSKSINHSAIPADVDINEVPELEALKKGYIIREEIFVNPIKKFIEDGKLKITDADGRVRDITETEILNCRYVPYPKGEKYEFNLDAATIDKGGFTVPVFECKVDFTDLLADMDHQLVINKISEYDRCNKYTGWKVGDMTQPITDGNFE